MAKSALEFRVEFSETSVVETLVIRVEDVAAIKRVADETIVNNKLRVSELAAYSAGVHAIESVEKTAESESIYSSKPINVNHSRHPSTATYIYDTTSGV